MTVETDNSQSQRVVANGVASGDSPPAQQQQRKKDKNKRKKERKRQSRQQRGQQPPQQPLPSSQEDSDDDIEVEYVFEDPPELTDVRFRHFRKIFQAFRPVSEAAGSVAGGLPAGGGADALGGPADLLDPAATGITSLKARAAMLHQDDGDDADDDLPGGSGKADPDDDVQKLSKRKLKKLTRMSVAELKQIVDRPEVVEMHDICARDPKLLCHLKAYRNVVPVPRHWCAKRKYLQGKRGIEKAPFQLPDFIKATGIMEMRDTVHEKDDSKTLKQKMRERVRPKVGKIDIDYQKLHDAFFKFQTKPFLSSHGDLYYEGREFETRLRAKKPGALSEDLRTALGMPVGPGSEKYPPPWLIAMQRYGPPPAFPNLRIAGLNAPIPEGCSFGYHAGGWGKPPVDAHGRPVYGDVFGYAQQPPTQPADSAPTERRLWGELESESSEDEEEEDDEDEEGSDDEEAGDGEEGGTETPAGMITPSGGLSSATPAGLETPDMIELRKQRTQAAIAAAMEGDADEATLGGYRVLPEVQTNVGDAFLGSSRIYDVSGVSGGAVSGGGAASGAGSSNVSRKRTRGGPQQQGTASSASAGAQSASGVSAAKKYAKDYKF